MVQSGENESRSAGAGSPDARARAGDQPEAGDARGGDIRGVDIRSVESRALMEGARELVILHGADRYRLRITANDKLILTK